jgi:uracil-DNA glycosylase family 4
MFDHSYFGKITEDDFGKAMRLLYEKIQKCTRCESCKKDCNLYDAAMGHGKVAFSFNRGKVLLVGESPNSRRVEAPLALIPFCLDWDLQKNKSGEILKMMIEENSLNAKDFCSTNLVKCSVFSEEEFESCWNSCKFYFEDQVKQVEPLLIIGLGERVRKVLGGKMLSFTEYITNTGYKYKLVCIKHPAWVLRDRQENLKIYRENFKIVVDWLKTHTARQHSLDKFGFQMIKDGDDKDEEDKTLNF